jgi:hypothetical protein
VNLTATIPGATVNDGYLVTLGYDQPITSPQGVLRWDIPYAPSNGTVTVPVCNVSSSPVTPLFNANFFVHALP